jgi:RND family efflux transporter MFP subunit
MHLFRRLSFYLALAGVALTVFLIKTLTAPGPEPHYVPPPLNPYHETIAASGIIEAADKNIEIGVPHSALIKDVYVKAGDTVEMGHVLFKLDDRELLAQLIVQNANVAILEAAFHRAADRYGKLASIEDIRAVSREELDTMRHDASYAKAQHDAAEAEVTRTLLLLERLQILAPKKGTILQNNIRKGEYVSAGNPPAMVLGDMESLQIRADIDEQNACFFSCGSAAAAFPKNNPEMKIPLRFERIEPYVIPKKSLTGAGDERVDTRVLQVVYLLDKPEGLNLYPGQQVDIFIERKNGQSVDGELSDEPADKQLDR